MPAIAPNHGSTDDDSGVARERGSDVERGSPTAGVLQSISLVYHIPGFFKFLLFVALVAGGVNVPWVYVVPVLQQQVWGDNAAANASWMQACRALMSVLLAAHFGQWSDGRGKRFIALLIMVFASFSIGLPMLFLGMTSTALWISAALIVVTGPFALHLSGSPVLWAMAADILPIEHRETGFALTMASVSFGTFLMNIVSKLLADSLYPGNTDVFLWVAVSCLFLSVLLLISLRCSAMKSEPLLEDEDEASHEELVQQRGCRETFLSPMKLIWSKPTLRAICIVSALLTLADIAASDVSTQVLFEMLGIAGDGNTAKQQAAQLYYIALANPPFLIIAILIGPVAKRFGPHKFIQVWLPITGVLFATPALLTLVQSNWMILLSGLSAMLPLSNYGPLQALVTHVVPPWRVGEAMGCLALCKNVVSLIAPLAMATIAQAFANTGNNDKLWVVYPGCACALLCAWPFTFSLKRRVPGDTNAMWASWVSTAIASPRPSRFSTAMSARLARDSQSPSNRLQH